MSADKPLKSSWPDEAVSSWLGCRPKGLLGSENPLELPLAPPLARAASSPSGLRILLWSSASLLRNRLRNELQKLGLLQP